MLIRYMLALVLRALASNRLVVFNARTGVFVRTIGAGAGGAEGMLAAPRGLVVHAAMRFPGLAFVVEFGNNRVQVLPI